MNSSLLFQRALAIREKALRPDHPDVANTLYTLVTFHRVRGEYLQAEQLGLRALTIREKTLGPDHPDLAERLTEIRSQIARLVLRKPQRMTAEQHQARIKELEDQA
jgi:hypothetical protein